MPTSQAFEEKFWKALKSDMTMMVGLGWQESLHPRPMTAQLDGERGPIWFFTSKDTELFGLIGQGRAAFATFVDKSHNLFATVQGVLTVDTDRAKIDRLWNRYVAAWFQDGKDDSKLALLRFDPRHAEIWVDASSLVAGIKLLLGVDPKQEYRDKVAKVDLSS